MKIAFATKDNITVNDHFGWCRTFAVYNVDRENFKFIEFRNVHEGRDEMDKIDKRIEAIKDCTILYCSEIGATAAARVVRSRIHPMKSSGAESIEEILNKLITVLKKPPIWLRKVLQREE
ncbi:MAG: nitrogen fixation protein NifX [Nitrospinae bacterium]|nr:nitrogen fixation protein NifX [Nitrospinota bacterium]